MSRFIRRLAMPLLLTTTATSPGCYGHKPAYLDVGPVFVTSDVNDIDMHRTKVGFCIVDPNNPRNVIRLGKSGRWVSDKFMAYLLERAAK
jgi:hypothetical protein